MLMMETLQRDSKCAYDQVSYAFQARNMTPSFETRRYVVTVAGLCITSTTALMFISVTATEVADCVIYVTNAKYPTQTFNGSQPSHNAARAIEIMRDAKNLIIVVNKMYVSSQI